MKKFYCFESLASIKRYRVFLLICICAAASLTSDAQKYGWAKFFNPQPTIDPTILILTENRAMVRDLSGNFYLTGTFADTVDFDPGPAVYNLSTKTPSTQNQFVTKLSPDGNLIWADNIGNNSVSGGQIFPNAIAVGTDGSVYTTGYFNGTVDFDPGPGVANFTTTALSPGNVFVSKLNPGGTYAWTKVFIGTNSVNANQDNGYAIAVDGANNVYATVEFFGTIDVDPGPGVINLVQNAFSDAAVVKLDPAGNYLTNHVITSNGSDRITGIIYKNGLVYADTWKGTTATITKFDPSLNVIWEKSTQNIASGSAWPWGFTIDDAGNVIISGIFSSFVDFDPGPGTATQSATGSADRFICKWDRNGNFQWVRTSTQDHYETKVTSDRNGDIYYSSYSYGQFGGMVLDITKLNFKGDYQWTAEMTCTNSFVGRDILADDNGNIYTCGYFFNTADFDPDPNVSNTLTTTPNATGAFISKISNRNHIMGKTFIDVNNDGIQQAGENPFPYRIIDAQSGGLDFKGFSTTDGSYDIYTDTGTYNITVPYVPPYYTSAVTNTASFATGIGGVDSLNDFPIYPMPNVKDLSVNLYANGRLRQGREYWTTIAYRNTGTTTLSGSVTLQHSPAITYVLSQPAASSYNNPLVTWNFLNLQPFETRYLFVDFWVPPGTPNGTMINQVATVNPIINDTTPLNNKDSVTEFIVGSYDPNNKSVFPSGGISKTFLCSDSSLNYTIRFQNTGTDTALLVIVSDTIQNDLDINTLQVTGASHPFSVRIDEGKTIKFIFKNIFLPDSTTNEPRSHGFIAYKIKPFSNLSVGATVTNMSSIFFDFNKAVLTNQTGNTVTPMQPAQISISTASANSCPNSPITFNATASYGGTAPVYQWQVNSVNAGTNSSVFTSSTLNNGDQVRCLLTSNASCVTTANATSNIITVTISSSVVPSVGITTPNSNICSGSPVTFTATPANGGPAASYQWQINGINAGTNSNSFTTSALTNNAQVKVILTSSLSCASPATATSNIIIMTVTPLPIANAGNDVTICSGSSTQLQASGGTTYTWSPATGLSNPNIANPIASPLATTAYILTVSNGGTCTSKDTVVVNVGQSFTPTINISTPTTNICSGTATTFTAAATYGGSSPAYQWKVNGVNAGTNSNTFTSSSLQNNDQVKVTLTSNLACVLNNNAISNVITMSVQQLSVPVITVSNRLFTVTNPDAAATYTWQIRTNSVWVNVIPLATGISYTAAVAGEYRAKGVKGACTYYSSSKVTSTSSPYYTFIILRPNPANRMITLDSLDLSKNWETVEIMDMQARRVLPIFNIINQFSYSIDISTLSDGVYFAIVKQRDGTYTAIRFVKQ